MGRAAQCLGPIEASNTVSFHSAARTADGVGWAPVRPGRQIVSAIEIIQPIAGALYLGTITTVGIRLIVLSRRHRALPELLLGLSLLLGGTFGAVLEVAGMSPDAPIEPQVAGLLLAIGKGLVVGGFLCQVLFIRIVFRPNEKWATALVAAMLFVQLTTFAAFATAGTFSNGEMPTSIFLFEFASRTTGSIWLVAESLRYNAVMRRRLALGLADPLVCDRFRLWAIAGSAAIVMLATSAPPVVAENQQAPWVTAMLPLFAASGIAASCAYLLAFFPPGWYRRRVIERAGPYVA
jgi:hypothetical protein